MGPHNLINLFSLSVAVLIDWPDQILSFRRNFFLNKKFKSFNESVSQAIGIPKASNKLPQFISISAKLVLQKIGCNFTVGDEVDILIELQPLMLIFQQIILTSLAGRSISVRLTRYFTGLYSTKIVNLFIILS